MPQVNGDNLLHQQIVKRTREALQAQDETFTIEHENSSDAELIDYVRCCVNASYTSAPCEVVGGAYIAQRFGNWSAALKAAGLPSQYKPPRENGYHRFHEEYARQEARSCRSAEKSGRPRLTSSPSVSPATRPAPPPMPQRLRKRKYKNRPNAAVNSFFRFELIEKSAVFLSFCQFHFTTSRGIVTLV